jgi:hypothetical protein
MVSGSSHRVPRLGADHGPLRNHVRFIDRGDMQLEPQIGEGAEQAGCVRQYFRGCPHRRYGRLDCAGKGLR